EDAGDLIPSHALSAVNSSAAPVRDEASGPCRARSRRTRRRGARGRLSHGAREWSKVRADGSRRAEVVPLAAVESAYRLVQDTNPPFDTIRLTITTPNELAHQHEEAIEKPRVTADPNSAHGNAAR